MTVPMHQEYLPKLIKVLPEILGIDKIAVFVSKDNQLELKIINGSLNKKIMYKCEDEHHPVHKSFMRQKTLISTHIQQANVRVATSLNQEY